MTALTTRFEKYWGFQTPLVWRNVIGIFILYLVLLYTPYLIFFKAKWSSTIVAILWSNSGGLAITIGAHRLWTHKTFKGTLPLRIFIMFWYLTSGMYPLVQWVRDHRTHHKYTETNADPHNAARGFFFCHCGWLMMKRHPELKEKGKLIDISDLMEDPVVRFEEKYFAPLFIVCFFIIPFCISNYILEETVIDSIIGFILGRYIWILNSVWCVNSLAHLWGYKPYNKNIGAVQNKLGAFVTLGEAWHNFHHTFPWDYRIGELGQGFQVGTYFIDLFAWLGLAYDLKTASPEMVKKVLSKAGELEVNEEIPYEEDKNDKEAEEDVQEKVKVN